MALALSQDTTKHTTQAAYDAIMGFLSHRDNTGNAYDDSNYTAAWLLALGHLRPERRSMVDAMLRQLDR